MIKDNYDIMKMMIIIIPLIARLRLGTRTAPRTWTMEVAKNLTIVTISHKDNSFKNLVMVPA